MLKPPLDKLRTGTAVLLTLYLIGVLLLHGEEPAVNGGEMSSPGLDYFRKALMSPHQSESRVPSGTRREVPAADPRGKALSPSAECLAERAQENPAASFILQALLGQGSGKAPVQPTDSVRPCPERPRPTDIWREDPRGHGSSRDNGIPQRASASPRSLSEQGPARVGLQSGNSETTDVWEKWRIWLRSGADAVSASVKAAGNAAWPRGNDGAESAEDASGAEQEKGWLHSGSAVIGSSVGAAAKVGRGAWQGVKEVGKHELNPINWRPRFAREETNRGNDSDDWDAWEFAVGSAFRTGGRVTFKARPLIRRDGGQFVNGSFTDGDNFIIEGDPYDTASGENVSPQLDIIGWQETDPDGDSSTTADNNGDEIFTRNVTFDRSSLLAADADLDDSLVISMEATRNLGKNPLRLSAVSMGFGLSKTRTKMTATSGNGIATTTLTGILYRTGATSPGDDSPTTPYEKEGGNLEQGSPANLNMTDSLFDLGGTRTTDVTVDLEAETLEFDLHLGLEHALGITNWCDLYIGYGPALSVVFLKTEHAHEAVWDAPANALDGHTIERFSDEEDDGEIGVLYGFYTTAGLHIQLFDRLGLDLGCRYDARFGELETDHASLDVDNRLSLEARLIFNY